MNLGWRGEPSPCIVPFLVSLRSWELGIDQSLLMFWLYTPSALWVKEEEGITPGPAVIYSSPPPAPSWCDPPTHCPGGPAILLPHSIKAEGTLPPNSIWGNEMISNILFPILQVCCIWVTVFFFSQNCFCLSSVSHIFIFIDPLFCYDDISRVWSWESACSQYKLTILWGIRRPELSHQLKTEKGK